MVPSERVEPGEGAADRERVDLIGALVREGGLQIRGVAHDVEVAGDAVRAEERARPASGLQGDPAVVALQQAGLHRVELAAFLQPRVVQREQRGLHHLGGDVGELGLHQLLRGDGDPELDPLPGIRDGLLETGAGGAEHAEGDAEPGIVEAGERGLEARRLGQAGLLPELDLVQVEGARHAGPHAQLVRDVAGGKARPVALDDEPDDSIGALRPDDGEVGELRVGDPELAAGDRPALLRAERAGLHRAGITAVLRLGEAEASDRPSRRHLREPLLLLRLGPVTPDGEHGEAGLDRHEGAQAGVARLQLVAGETVCEAAHAGAAVTLEVGAEEPELSQLRDQLRRESPRLVIGDDPWHAALPDEPSYAAAHQLFLFVEERLPADQLLDVHGVHASLVLPAYPGQLSSGARAAEASNPASSGRCAPANAGPRARIAAASAAGRSSARPSSALRAWRSTKSGGTRSDQFCGPTVPGRL